MSGSVAGFLAGETITIVRPGAVTGQDQYGNDIRAAATEIDVAGCAVAPGGSSEDVQARDQVAQHLTVWAPSGTVVLVTDRVRRGGVLYDVDSAPETWRSAFTGFTGPVQLSLRKVTG